MQDNGHDSHERTMSYWRDGVSRPQRAPLTENTQTAVVIVGSGIAGLSTAYALAREGVSVVVVDAGQVGGGMTERTSAHLSNAVDDRFVEIERRHGVGGARICAESHSAAIEFIASAVERESIDCGFERVDGFLFAGPGQSPRRLERELDAARRAGLEETQWAERAPIAGFDTGRCLRFPRQAQFHPLRYLVGLAAAVERHGGRIFCGTKVADIAAGRTLSVATAAGATITAENVVVATNSPVNDRIAMHTKQAAYRTYVIAGLVPKGAVTRALFWDDEDPYHYVRTSPSADGEHDLLIVGGEDHKTGQRDDGAARFAALERWARERFASLGKVTHQWSGQVLEPFDGVAFIGRNPGSAENVYIATGDSGMGLTHGAIAGVLLTDLIAGRGSPWSKLYDPSRKMLSAPLEFAKENLNVAAQYLEAYSGSGDVKSVEAIAPGCGATLRDGFAKVAVYRDDDGSLHECSAVCTHLGGIVSWNSVERTWDCPCHGSRFDRFGKVITGPANRDLAGRA